MLVGGSTCGASRQRGRGLREDRASSKALLVAAGAPWVKVWVARGLRIMLAQVHHVSCRCALCCWPLPLHPAALSLPNVFARRSLRRVRGQRVRAKPETALGRRGAGRLMRFLSVEVLPITFHSLRSFGHLACFTSCMWFCLGLDKFYQMIAHSF